MIEAVIGVALAVIVATVVGKSITLKKFRAVKHSKGVYVVGYNFFYGTIKVKNFLYENDTPKGPSQDEKDFQYRNALELVENLES